MTTACRAILVLCCLTGMTSSMFLDNAFQQDCPAPSPCTCDTASFINCNVKGFSKVPTFLNSTRTYGTMDLSINMNHVHELADNSFQNLNCSLIHGTLLISLYNNGLRNISEHAFAPIENCVNYLNLDSNQLTHLPKALLHLPNLKHLLLEHNPIQSFDPTIMQSLGKSLNILYVGARYLAVWPQELQHLTKLTGLRMFDVDFPDMNATAFDGFSQTLKQLEIEGTSLQRLPPSLCNMTSLQTLWLTSDQLIQNVSDFLPFCSSPLTTVQNVKFDRCNLHTLWSNIFFLFPNMVTLQMSNNPQLTQIDEGIIPDNKMIRTLDLHGNALNSIPQAVHKIHSLHSLDVSGNQIMTVENEELQNMAFLTSIKLQNNQLTYIANDAFKFQSGLRTLNLANNKLRELPRAVQDISNLGDLDVSGNPINCDCSLTWVKTWSSYPAVNIHGLCYQSTVTVSSYLSTGMAQC